MEFQTKRHYKVKGFHQSCPHNYMQKLLSLGFIPESQFYIEKKALFGNPYHITIKNFSVSLRKSELQYIEVESL
ncbi:FeoA domain-containing protein [Fangia hongkongensis]|uniref:FeoA domain-containing protein n=1 Tax=Fangia hongkongensis TaxID=270495 RepID=UPI00037FC061|nr:FeoA domain-containing protein [Fangia hongkongensis]MBK2124553.1 FeoA domain-containing protein [Fangia hongkongensis]